MLRFAAVAALLMQSAPSQPPAATLTNDGAAMKVPFACLAADLDWAGLACSEEEHCPIYLDLASVHAVGRKLFLPGNLHSAQTTLFSVLLQSDDGGKTWREPVERVRGAELDKVQFFSFDNGWISGQTVYPLPGDPFFVFTHDGGKSWRRQPILEEGSPGSVQKFLFRSGTSGSVVVDRGPSESGQMRFQLYETPNGGESWMIRESSETPIALPAADAGPDDAAWRVHPNRATDTLQIEKRADKDWTTVARFSIRVADCTGEKIVTPPPPAEQPATEKKDYVEELRLGSPKSNEKSKKKPK